jgi:hypothetical protein
MLRTVECCQMAARLGGRIADQGRGPSIREMLGTMPARLACPITHCFR